LSSSRRERRIDLSMQSGPAPLPRPGPGTEGVSFDAVRQIRAVTGWGARQGPFGADKPKETQVTTLTLVPAAPTGANIRRLREASGWPQKQLARFLNVNVATVRAWETGNQPIPSAQVGPLADAFGVSREQVLGHDDRPRSLRAATRDAHAALDRLASALSPMDPVRVPVERLRDLLRLRLATRR
jgi:transcriptional regulator with XRE-family HTH domain